MKNCIVCGSELKLFGTKDRYEIYKCLNCGLGNTKNTKLQTGSYHRDDEYLQEEGLFENIFQKRVDVISNLAHKGNALEIGCSTGILLSLLQKRGWDVLGVELSPKAAQEAKRRGIKVIIDTFENVKFNKKFDLIIFNHVLEHIKDPHEVLLKTNQILLPGGLVLISLPNFDSFSAKLEKEDWPLLLPSEHLWHFTTQSLSLMLKNLNFDIVYQEQSSGIWDYGNPLLGLWTSLASFKKRFFSELMTAIPSFLFTKLGIGSGLIIIAKKK